MTHKLRTILAAALIAGLSPAIAQQFNTIPDHSVIGRVGPGSGSGPSQAITFSNLSNQLSPLLNLETAGFQPITGLVSDAVQASTTVSITSGLKVLVTGSTLGASCKAGSTVVIPGAGVGTAGTGVTDYAPLVAKVTSVNGFTYVLDTAAQTTVATTKTVTCGTDNTAAVQAGINANANPYFKVGGYLIASDITVPSGRTILVPAKSSVFSAGRFTTAAASSTNVKYTVDGTLCSLGLQPATDMSSLGWPSGERAFIEFGGSSANPSSNFTVTGTGKICGDFSGSSIFNNQTYQLNRKGIASWFAANVLVNVREVSGFHGETVYALPGPGTVQSIRFTGMYVHDVRFTGININAPQTSPAVTFGGNEGFLIDHNYVVNSYVGIESPIGTVTANRINNYVYTGIQWGLGSGQGPMIVSYNTVVGGGSVSGSSYNICGSASRSSVGMCLAFGSSPTWNPGTNFIVVGNVVYNPGDSCYVLVNTSYGQFSNNQCNGAGQTTSAVSFDFSNVHYVFGNGNSDINAGAHWTASMGSASSDNLALGPVVTAAKGSLVAMGNDNIGTYIAPGASAGQALINNVGAAPSWGSIGVAGGGTGASSLTAHAVLLGNGTSAIGSVLGSTSGKPLVAAGSSADPTFSTLGISGGGTNCAAAAGTCLDNITGFASNGMMVRTGAGTYTFTNPTGAVKNNGSGTLTQAASTDLSDTTAATTWTATDASGAGLAFTSVTGNYSKTNRTCVGNFRLTYPSTASGSIASFNLPCTAANNGNQAIGSCFTTTASPNGNLILTGTANAATGTPVNSNAAATVTNTTLSTATISCNFAFITN